MRINNKSEKSDPNIAALKKPMEKEVEHRWALPLTIDLIRHIKDAGVVTLLVARQFSINKKGEQ